MLKAEEKEYAEDGLRSQGARSMPLEVGGQGNGKVLLRQRDNFCYLWLHLDLVASSLN